MPPALRPAVVADAQTISDIYNYHVLHSTCTYQEAVETVDDRVRFIVERDPVSHPLTVAECGGAIVGFGSLSPFHHRSGYRFTVENAVYVRHDRCGEGIGALLLMDLIERAKRARHHSIVALIDSAQPASIALHRRFGFQHAGTLPEAGFKFGRWLDLQYHQLIVTSSEVRDAVGKS